MKSFYLLLCLLAAPAALLFTQNVPNGGFENWEITPGGAFEPVFWETLNTDDFANIFQVEGHTGYYAVQLSVEWDENMSSYMGPMMHFDGNIPLSQKFTSLNFFIKGTSVGGDYLQLTVGMFKEGALIGSALYTIGETYENWTEISIPIGYANDEVPDEGFIGILTPSFNAHYGTSYIIDDMNFSMGGGPVAPSLFLANTNETGTVFELFFTTPMANPAGKHNQFSATHNGSPVNFTSASLAPGEDHIILLTLSTPVVADEVLRVSYTAGNVASSGGLPLESFSNHPVANLVGGSEAVWQIIPSGVTENLLSVHFADQHTGFVSGAGATCLKSANSGNHWTKAGPSSYADFYTVYAATPQDIYVGAWDTVYYSHNGGQSWNGGFINTLNFYVFDLQFLTPTQGFAFIQVSAIVKTTNGGATWTEPSGSGIIEDNLAGFMFDNQNGFAVGQCGHIARTIDGGDTWEEYPWNNWEDWSCIDINGLHFTSPNKGYAVADSGVVFRTTDGGIYWSRSEIAGPDDDLTDVYFTDPNHGWISAFHGQVFSTTDGGENWALEPVLTTSNLNGIFFISNSLGWAVGDNGVILRFGAGGPSGVNEEEGMQGAILPYPNPAEGGAQIELTILEEGYYTLELIDTYGRMVGRVLDGSPLSPGRHTLQARLQDLPGGIYACRLSNEKGQSMSVMLSVIR